MFVVLALIVFLIPLICIYFYASKSIAKYGFNNINIFILIYTIFYILVPFFSIFFKDYRDDTTLYNMVLNSFNDYSILFNSILCIFFLGVILFVYHNPVTREPFNIEINKEEIHSINIYLYKKINRFADGIFIIGGSSIIILVISSGGILNYLALGSSARGATSTISDHISSGLIPLITLSVIILVCPYLYYYLLKVKNNNILKFKFILSMLLVIFYLIYNQGRAPLLLFLLPFFLVSKFMKRKKLLKLVLLFLTCFPLLNILNGFFLYLSYGVYRTEEHSILSSFLLEFSYPFTNFLNRNYLIEVNGFRYGLDYIYWFFTLIPNSILKLIGLSKDSIETLGSLNTNGYSIITNSENQGGIPVDFLTFNYYEGGYLTLLIALVLTGYLLKILDRNFLILKNNLAIKIILYRISISILNLITNSDWSVIARTRTDIIILVFFVIYISWSAKRRSSIKKYKESL
jgi:oligosaccharide repeat unit polymerase